MKFELTQQSTSKRSKLTMASGDLIAKTIRQDILDFRMQSFETFGIDTDVREVSTARPLIDAKERWVGFDEYSFDVFGQPRKLMEVRINSSGQVRIWYQGRWRPVASFLKQLKPAIDWNATDGFHPSVVKQNRWEQQSRWWVANGKKFRLMDLPSEVREMIYGHVFGEFITAYPKTGKNRGLSGLQKAQLAYNSNSNLLKTSRQVYEEASNILYMYTPFRFDNNSVLKRFTCNVRQRSRIRQVTLALSHDDFTRLFSPDTKSTRGKKTDSQYRTAQALEELRLNRLELCFAAPTVLAPRGEFDGVCQKNTVDKILSLAWSIIRGHPVKLSGYIKNSQKAMYEAVHLVERKKFEMWQKYRVSNGEQEGRVKEYHEEIDEEEGGVLLNEKAREEQARILTEDFRFVSEHCFCNIPCTKETWTNEG